MRTPPSREATSLALLACLLAVAMARALAAPAIGAPAPAFAARQTDGSDFDTRALRGKVVLLHFWATWCDSCRTEMPALEQVYADLHGRGLELLTISADDPPDRRAAIDLARTFHLPAALLESARPNGYGRPPVLPLTFIVDRAGLLRARLLPTRGPLTAADLRTALEPLLASADPVTP
jgi:cytochrome c biogenesis protein CcmG, thiol:disulfide interchange protein DsbE